MFFIKLHFSVMVQKLKLSRAGLKTDFMEAVN